mmetsp:Transcript_33502/g.81284  ORF Transcript_33502/g.81284 Transcript_33502/m.81284 type:complete len:141 (+) Transcript_33502:260-682(+)
MSDAREVFPQNIEMIIDCDREAKSRTFSINEVECMSEEGNGLSIEEDEEDEDLVYIFSNRGTQELAHLAIRTTQSSGMYKCQGEQDEDWNSSFASPSWRFEEIQAWARSCCNPEQPGWNRDVLRDMLRVIDKVEACISRE